MALELCGRLTLTFVLPRSADQANAARSGGRSGNELLAG